MCKKFLNDTMFSLLHPDNENLLYLEHSPNSLGEGLYINSSQTIVAWVDINENRLFYFHVGDQLVYDIILNSKPSCIIDFVESNLSILTNTGIVQFNINDRTYVTLNHFNHEIDSDVYRTNDAVKMPFGSIFFGTMHKETPNCNYGALWICSDNSCEKIDDIYIPNAFIVVNDFILVADSSTQIIHKYDALDFRYLGVWSDLSHLNITPDGGCLGPDNNIYIALWGNSSIGKFDISGNLLHQINIPVYQPTNCKTFGTNLLVTSAVDCLTNEQINEYPCSGKLLMIKDVFK